MDTRLRNIIIALAMGLSLFCSGHWYGQRQLKQELRAAAGLNSEVLLQLQQRDSLHRAEEARLEAAVLRERDLRAMNNQQHAADLARERSRPPRYVQVPVLRIMECDSAIASGQSFQRESELQRAQIIELKEVISVQDTAIEYLGDIAEMAEQRHRDDQAVIASAEAGLAKEKKRKVAWRGVAAGSLSALLLVLLL